MVMYSFLCIYITVIMVSRISSISNVIILQLYLLLLLIMYFKNKQAIQVLTCMQLNLSCYVLQMFLFTAVNSFTDETENHSCVTT